VRGIFRDWNRPPKIWWFAGAGVLILVVGAVGVVALSGGGGSKQAAPTTTASTLPATTTTVAPPTAPLTGLPDPTGAAASRPALVVKVENTEQARPQSGIDQADVVYEEVVEGNITRFVTIYNSSIPDPIGPIRSVRARTPTSSGPSAASSCSRVARRSMSTRSTRRR
jgi:hypothetical protein